MTHTRPLIAAAGLVAAFGVSALSAQTQAGDSRRAMFDSTDVMIPMRDGVKLHTILLVPKGLNTNLPFMMARTPYGVGHASPVLNSSYAELVDDGYIFVLQDIRGRFGSEGQFVMLRNPRNKKDPKAIDESTDTYDTIDWLLKNVPHNNGRVGQLGVSYPGWLTVMSGLDPHPAMKAISPQASPASMFLGDDFHHNGAFRLAYGFEYAAMMEGSKEITPLSVRPIRQLRMVAVAGVAGEHRREVSEGHPPDLDQLRRASRLRRVLAARGAGAIPRQRSGPDAERGRMVGPGGLLRSNHDLSCAREARHAAQELPRRRSRGITAGGADPRAPSSAPSTSAAKRRRTIARTFRRPGSPIGSRIRER